MRNEKTAHYSGVRELSATPEFIAGLHETRVGQLDPSVAVTCSPNEFLIMRIDESSKPTIARYKHDGIITLHSPISSMLSSRNKEQSWAFELLHDESVQLVSLTGPAGVGKTILALSAGLSQLGSRYSRLIVTRPVIPLGRDLGHLPGTLEEKMDPWLSPIKDNLEFIFRTSVIQSKQKKSTQRMSAQTMIDNGTLEIQAISHVRGRSLPNAYIVIDEAQNLDHESIKTLITRAGEGTKVILNGDVEQTDSKIRSGLSDMVEAFRPYAIAGHIDLIKGERSPLATLASKIL